MKIRIFWKLFAAFALLAIVTVAILSAFLVVRLQRDVETKISQRLLNNAFLAGAFFKQPMVEGEIAGIQQEAKNLAAALHLRITVIDAHGKVLGDSERDASSMENHGDRAEFTEAVQKGLGQSTRFSHTLGYPMKYVAVRVGDGDRALGVVRIAVPLSEVQFELNELYKVAMLGAGAAICIALIIAYFVASSISSPIRQMKQIAERMAKGEFSERVQAKGSDELAELASALNTMADELQLKIERLSHLDKVRTDFVANVSHELKTPLTSILGFVETLEDGAIDDRQNARKFLAIIRKHTQRLASIINDLLSLSELEQHDAGISKTDFDLRELINEVVAGFAHRLDAKHQVLRIDSQGSDFRIAGDRDRIEQVLVNLIDNAVKYTNDNGRITVGITDKGDAAAITVEDNGIGIPKEDIGRVFERFYRVDKARSRELGGTGLGLSIAKHIVLAHGGAIHIESDLGRGTKVVVALPKK